MDYVTLNNGVRMPQLGYGVYRWPRLKPNGAWPTLSAWGYRSIDTAGAYGNEHGVGDARRKSGVSRDAVPHHQGMDRQRRREKAAASIDASPASPSRPIMWTCCSSTSPLGITTVPIGRWKGLPRRQGPRDRREQFLPRPLYRPRPPLPR